KPAHCGWMSRSPNSRVLDPIMVSGEFDARGTTQTAVQGDFGMIDLLKLRPIASQRQQRERIEPANTFQQSSCSLGWSIPNLQGNVGGTGEAVSQLHSRSGNHHIPKRI